MDQGDAEVLERIERGERTSRPGAPTESARRSFETLVGHLRELRERELIDLPERHVAQIEDTQADAYLLAGPCQLTEAGRAALAEFRRGDRRADDRRSVERRRDDRADLPPGTETAARWIVGVQIAGTEPRLHRTSGSSIS
jgi:hypothetical protein